VNTTTATPTPEALAIAVIFKDFAIDHTPDGWPAVKQMHLNAAAAELERQHAEIERLTAENKALRAKIELIDYVLQDNLHNRLTPRVVDIAYSAFTIGRRDTPHDWFNDTKPMVMEQLSKIQKHLAEEAAHGIGASECRTSQHADDDAVDTFAQAVKAKMARQRAKGYSGWRDCPAEKLRQMLIDHISKGDPVDGGNFAMMLFNRVERT